MAQMAGVPAARIKGRKLPFVDTAGAAASAICWWPGVLPMLKVEKRLAPRPAAKPLRI